MANDRIGPGTTLDGKYEILSMLGAGGMGAVYKARHLHLDAFRCIKVMKQSLLENEAFRARFLREARLATQIHHPNIAVVHDFFLGEGGSYLVTEFIDGSTLRQWSNAYGAFPIALAADVATQVLAGLDHIHRRGLLHRDISADNVMLSYNDDDRLTAKIIDLGVAKDINTGSSDETTQTGMLVGNPKYMSPEQFGMLPDGEQIDGRTDLYSLGVVLYEMLVGVSPFASETPQGYIMKHLTQPPPSFGASNKVLEWPRDLEAIVLRALEKDRSRRFLDAREFAIALEPFRVTPGGMLTRTDVGRLRRSESATLVLEMPKPLVESETEKDWKTTVGRDTAKAFREFLTKHPDAPDSTEAKARLFVLELIETIRAKEEEGDKATIKRLAEAHPPSSLVGNAAREALARMKSAQDREQEAEEAYRRAWEMGTSDAWLDFVESYPISPRYNEAQNLLAEAAAFESASSETGLREFLKLFPEGRHHIEAEIRLASLRHQFVEDAFARARAAGTYTALREFITKFPSSPHLAEAKSAAAERSAYETASAIDSEESWEEYLAKYPQASGDAHARRDAARQREDEAFRRAAEQRTARAWEEFVAGQPEGRRKTRGELHRREAAAFEAARAEGREALIEFTNLYPNGLLVKDARRAIRLLVDEDDYVQAHAVGTAVAWHFYLTEHAGGAHADEARQRLEELEDAAFAQVLSSKDVKAAQQFLSDFNDSPRYDEVARLVAKWDETAAVADAHEAIARRDLGAAHTHLARVTDDSLRDEIRESLDALARQTEPRDFDAAWERGSSEAWDVYIGNHPESPRLAEASRYRQEAIDFELATSTNTPNMWRAFLKSWPEGRHRLEADIRLRASKGA